MISRIINWMKNALDILRDPFESAVCEAVGICTHFRQPIPLMLLWKDLAFMGR